MKNENSGKNRVLDAKAVTQLNSVRVSFLNRKENGGSLAKSASACAGSAIVKLMIALAIKLMGKLIFVGIFVAN